MRVMDGSTRGLLLYRSRQRRNPFIAPHHGQSLSEARNVHEPAFMPREN